MLLVKAHVIIHQVLFLLLLLETNLISYTSSSFNIGTVQLRILMTSGVPHLTPMLVNHPEKGLVHIRKQCRKMYSMLIFPHHVQNALGVWFFCRCQCIPIGHHQMQIINLRLPEPDCMVPQYYAIRCSAVLKSSAVLLVWSSAISAYSNK